MARCTMVLLLAVALLRAGPALAQAAAEGDAAEGDAPEVDTHPEDMQSAQRARGHFMEGLRAFEAHDYRAAIRAFNLAAQLVPSADLWYNIGRAHEELSEYEAAVEHYQRYLRDRVDPPDRERVEAHIERLRGLAAQSGAPSAAVTEGTLRLTANRTGTAVELDGEAAGTAPWETPRQLSAGRHRLELTREGYVPFRSEVSVEPGMTTAAYADLVPQTRYRAIRSDRVFTWIAWGLGLASLGVSIGLGVEALSYDQGTIQGRADAQTWAAYSDGLLGASIGFAVLGGILWFVEGRAVGTERVEVDDADAADIRGPE